MTARALRLRALLLSTFLASSLGLGACGDSPSGPEAEGTFRITLAGGVSRTFSGVAVFRAEPSFALWNGSHPEDLVHFGLGRQQGGRPSPGQYDLTGGPEEPEDFFGFGLSYTDDSDNKVVFVAQDGTVTIDRSSPGRVVGGVEAQLIGFRTTDAGKDSLSATATASFDAIPVSEFTPSGVRAGPAQRQKFSRRTPVFSGGVRRPATSGEHARPDGGPCPRSGSSAASGGW